MANTWASLVQNRGVEIGHYTIKNCIPWFYVTNALRKNTMTAWASRAFLSVNANYAKWTLNPSTIKCPNP
jgi:hypothetical protein